MAGGDSGQDLIRTRSIHATCGRQDLETLGDTGSTPEPSILVLEGHKITGLVEPGIPPCIMQDHERKQAHGFRLVRHQSDEQTAEAYGLGAEVDADEVRPATGCV